MGPWTVPSVVLAPLGTVFKVPPSTQQLALSSLNTHAHPLYISVSQGILPLHGLLAL